MPSFSKIQKEIQEQNVPDTQYNIIRKKYLRKLSEKTQRNGMSLLLGSNFRREHIFN